MNRVFITKSESFLQNTTIILKCNDFIAKCLVYYKMHWCIRSHFVSTEVIVTIMEKISSLRMESDRPSTQDMLTCNLVPRAVLKEISLAPNDFGGNFFSI